ncbi:cell division ATP-binding protein FtsE [Tuberibacillus sp. Marseille-P3662]|uniref:cell division ATP-binding protein FtsE n=1 Tax=Tuberibacillus sp. Marseille-P3662 TaxID=1965358 RepID=UPI000A1CBB7D|nr:cell division ATP-binding protein FtsE [Tuberibacillus sp. Marseille-P3662]
MIQMKDIWKSYTNGVMAVNNINVDIAKGEFVYIVGQSGSGKSTLIKLMYREEKPTKGQIIVDGKDVAKLKRRHVPSLRRQLGVVFQDYKLLPKLTIYENVAFALEVIEEHPRNIRRRVMDVLDLVKLKHKARFLPQELSGGEQQRISIARSIVNNPSIVVADEPTGNLDPDTAWGIMEVFERINNNGTTVVMATHNREIVNNLKRRVIEIEGGMIVRDEQRGEYSYEA